MRLVFCKMRSTPYLGYVWLALLEREKGNAHYCFPLYLNSVTNFILFFPTYDRNEGGRKGSIKKKIYFLNNFSSLILIHFSSYIFLANFLALFRNKIKGAILLVLYLVHSMSEGKENKVSRTLFFVHLPTPCLVLQELELEKFIIHQVSLSEINNAFWVYAEGRMSPMHNSNGWLEHHWVRILQQ